MEIILYVIISIIIGILIGFLFGKIKFNNLDKEFASLTAVTVAKEQSNDKLLTEKINEISRLNVSLSEKSNEIKNITEAVAVSNANYQSINKNLIDKSEELKVARQAILEKDSELTNCQKELATLTANNDALVEKLETQKTEMEQLGKKFTIEFENIANKILETKTEKFTELNKANLKTILEPLGVNIDAFKKQINDVYATESKERFSLGARVKELVELNHKISEEANNLTKALKGEAKTQGMWGEMILESILERSGLRKNEQYFLEHELKDENGNPILSAHEGKKMRPDVVIKYPDDRNVIIDSKVSLNAFTRLIAATDVEEQNSELLAHVTAIKTHINSLSNKGYDDYDKALDFVLMFVPSEPAYIAALQSDHDLWNYAYNKRILLISPTNLITSLKLIVDLWKREHQNRNALEIAERGAKLYDKFVGFISNLEEVGDNINKAQTKYNEAHKQLSTGNDNLVLQATKLKDLGLKTKKEIPKELINDSNRLNAN